MKIPSVVILKVLLQQPIWHEDVRDEKLLMPVAEAISEVSSSVDEAAALISDAVKESHLARYVIEGRCQDGPPGQRCDNGRARGPWQVHNWCKKEGLRGEAQCTLNILRMGLSQCHHQWAGAFSALGVKGCNDRQGEEKLRGMKNAVNQLQKELYLHN